MTMKVLNADYWNSYLQPYVADLGVALVFGVCYYLFKGLHKEKTALDSAVKAKIENNISKWHKAQTLQKFNSMIIANNDKSDDAFKILNAMQKGGVDPDIMTYNCLLDMSYKLEQTEQAKKLFEEISDFTSPVQPDIVTFNIILKGCVAELREINKVNNSASTLKNEILEKILSVIEDIKNRGLIMNDITYNTSIDGYIEGGNFNQAWELFSEMKNSETVKPDLYTYATIVKGLKNSNEHSDKNIEKALEILNFVKSHQKESFKVDEVLYNSVLDICIHYNKVELAEKIFEEMKLQGVNPSQVTFAIMIKGYGIVLKIEKAMSLLNEMKLVNVLPNEIIYGCLLNSAVKCSRIDIMEEIYNLLKADGFEPNQIIYTTLIKGYSKAKRFDKAFEIFDSITEKEKKTSNIVIFNSILNSCVDSKNYEKMEKIFQYLKKHSEESETFPQPNVITYSTVIKGYAKWGKMEESKSIYQYLKANAFQLDEVLFNTVCDAFARANQTDLALQVLYDMKKKGIKRSSIVYSILIKMYSNQANESKCLEVFKEMTNDNVTPSLVTYTTMIQLFIKIKKITRAIEVFEEMKKNGIKADQVIYNFMVNGCTFNKNLEKAIEYLLESIKENIKLPEESYGNCLGYLINNKFMKHNERVTYATKILTELKEKDFKINYEIYSKVLRLIYDNNDNNKRIESKMISNYDNESNSANHHTNNKKQKESLPKQRRHYYK